MLPQIKLLWTRTSICLPSITKAFNYPEIFPNQLEMSVPERCPPGCYNYLLSKRSGQRTAPYNWAKICSIEMMTEKDFRPGIKVKLIWSSFFSFFLWQSLQTFAVLSQVCICILTAVCVVVNLHFIWDTKLMCWLL